MKILFVSDIHGRVECLSKLESILDNEKIDKFVVLGDNYDTGYNYDYKENNKCINDFFSKYSDKLICVLGNCDSLYEVYDNNFSVKEGLLKYSIDNINMYFNHGDSYSYESGFPPFDTGVLVYGHYHIPKIRKDLDKVYICVGSISLPRGGSDKSYCIYEDGKFTLYNIDSEVIDEVSLK